MPTIVISTGQMVNGFIRPGNNYLGNPGPANEEVITCYFTWIDEDGIEDDFYPDEIEVLAEVHTNKINLPEFNGDVVIVGGTFEDDWEGEIYLEDHILLINTINNTGKYQIKSLFGFKILSLTYQGTTYTNFNYK